MSRRPLPFLRTIWRSSTSPAFYAELQNVSGWSTVRYMALLILLITLGIVTVATVVIANIHFPSIVRQAHQTALDRYPSDLAITVSGTGITINQPRPYAVPALQDADVDMQEPSAFVVFVDEDAVTFSNFDEFDAYAVLSPTELYVRQEAGQVVAHDVAGMLQDLEEPVTVDQALIMSVPVDEIAEYWLFQPSFYVPVAALILLVLLYPALIALIALTVLLWSLVLWLMLQFFQRTRGLKFGKVYQMGAHAYTPIMLVGYIFSELKGFIAFVIFLCFATAMIVTGQRHVVSVPAKPPLSARLPASRPATRKKASVKKKVSTKKAATKRARKQ